MIEIDCDNVVEYLHRVGILKNERDARAQWLTWGVSNVVLRVFVEPRQDIVVKQSREQLRTKADWFSRLDRIYREADVMQILAKILPPQAVPNVLFEDRENYVFVMEAIDAEHRVWKEDLLNGQVDLQMAEILAHYLATIHRETRELVDSASQLADCEVFDQLRVDPFYRYLINRHTDLKPAIDQLVAESLSVKECMVLADFSPKNILITESDGKNLPQVTLVDFETGHYGDPAFDLGFFLSHLMLKTVLHRRSPGSMLELIKQFWRSYIDGRQIVEASDVRELNRRTVAHLAGCMLARIDGKSPVDYLEDNNQQELVRDYVRYLFLSPVVEVEAAIDQLVKPL